MNQGKREPKLSLLGYVVLNVVAALLLAGIYLATRGRIGAVDLPPHGIAPLLVFVWLCFIAASIYDALFDRYADRVDQRPERDSLSDSGAPRE